MLYRGVLCRSAKLTNHSWNLQFECPHGIICSPAPLCSCYSEAGPCTTMEKTKNISRSTFGTNEEDRGGHGDIIWQMELKSIDKYMIEPKIC